MKTPTLLEAARALLEASAFLDLPVTTSDAAQFYAQREAALRAAIAAEEEREFEATRQRMEREYAVDRLIEEAVFTVECIQEQEKLEPPQHGTHGCVEDLTAAVERVRGTR
jgi:hypothetical protein